MARYPFDPANVPRPATDLAAHVRHLELSQDQQRAQANSKGDFRPRALCGNGSAHAVLRSSARTVNCDACRAIMAQAPHYLKTDSEGA